MSGLVCSMTLDDILNRIENLAYSEKPKDAILTIVEALKRLRNEIANVQSDLDACEGCGGG